MEKSVDQTISEMVTVGNQLVYYNFPQADPMLEESMTRVKTRLLTVDGYFINVHFSKADYGDRYVETVQIFGEKVPFLPFIVVAKVAKKFLGSAHLSLVEVFKENQKIYCWTVTLAKSGKAIPTVFSHEVETCKFDGWEYLYVDPSFVSIY